MVALEIATKISRHGGGERRRNEQSFRYRERVRKRKQPLQEEAVAEAARVITEDFFSATAAIAPAAMKGSYAGLARRCRDSAHTNAGAQWNVFGSGNGFGDNPDSKRVPDELEIVPAYCSIAAIRFTFSLSLQGRDVSAALG